MTTTMRRAPLDPKVLDDAAAMIRVLGHTDRLRIVECLEAGERTVSELQDELERRRITEGELARANQTLQLFGRLLQEEIKTSLFALRGYLSLIPPAESDISAQKSLESSRQLAASLEELVDSVRYLRDTGEKKQEWVEIAQAFLYARSHHKTTGIGFETDINGLELFAEPVFESLFSIHYRTPHYNYY